MKLYQKSTFKTRNRHNFQKNGFILRQLLLKLDILLKKKTFFFLRNAWKASFLSKNVFEVEYKLVYHNS